MERWYVFWMGPEGVMDHIDAYKDEDTAYEMMAVNEMRYPDLYPFVRSSYATTKMDAMMEFLLEGRG